MKPLPRVERLGRVKVNFVKVYSRDLVMKAHSEDGDDPELFVDVENSGRRGLELHLGVSANFRFEPWRYTAVKPHIDIYIPITEGEKIADIVEKLRGDVE